jgi:predicted nucleic acid-binding protein
MAYLLDTGILLRIVDAKDARHDIVMQAVQCCSPGQYRPA